MINTFSIKESKVFQKVINKGTWYGSNYFSVYILPNKEKANYIGLGVGKSAGKANKRNRIKRLIREAYTVVEQENTFKYGFSIVFIWKSRANFYDFNFESAKHDILKIFNKAEIIVK